MFSRFEFPQQLFKRICFAASCTVVGLSAIAFTQPSQANTQLSLTNKTSINHIPVITSNFHLIDRSYNTACPNNQPRSCSPGGSR